MGFPTPLTGGQTTQVRKDDQAFLHFLLVTPNDIVWQAEVDDTTTAENYATFAWTNTLQGVRTSVKVGQVLLVTSSTTDFSNPVIRGRVRAQIPDGTTVYCNEVGNDIDPTMYVTVFDDFDIAERLVKLDTAGTQFKDWSLPYSNLPPVVSGLQSAYADLSGDATVTIAFAPTVTAIASGAAVSSYLWDVGDGSITVGTSTDKDITVQFPGAVTNEHRWVHFWTDDDNGNSIEFHFQVFTVDRHSSSPTNIKLDTGQVAINASLEQGYNGNITVWDENGNDSWAITNVADQTRVVIVSLDDYDGTATPITNNIMMIGRTRTEISDSAGDEEFAVVQQATMQIEGFGTQLGNLTSPRLPIIDDDTPTAWGEITDPTLSRALVYIWANHSTILTLASFDFDDFSSYISDEYRLEVSNMLDVANHEAETCNAIVMFAPDGSITARRRAAYLATADRAALDTIFDFETQDIYSLSLDLEYGELVGQVEAGALAYSTTADETLFAWIGRAPNQGFGEGYETALLNRQVLAADASEADSKTEFAVRIANHLAYVDNKARLRADLMDGFYFVVPTVHQRYTFAIAATDTTRGRVFTASDYWQLVSLNYLADASTQTRALSGDFVIETTGGNAGVDIQLVRPVDDSYYTPPPLSGYNWFVDDPLQSYNDDSPDDFIDFEAQGDLEPQPANQNNMPQAGSETLSIPMYANIPVVTTRPTVNGEVYTVTVNGDGIIGDEIWAESLEYAPSNQGWATTPLGVPGDIRAGTWTSGTGWEDTDVVWSDALRGIIIDRDIALTTLTSVSVFYDAIAGVWEAGRPLRTAPRLLLWTGGQGGSLDYDSGISTNWGTGLTATFSLPAGVPADNVELFTQTDSLENPATTMTGDATYYRVDFQGLGTNPFSGNSTNQRGDAFYDGYESGEAELYAALTGLLQDAAKPASIPLYTPSHSYTYTFVGDGLSKTFQYVDADYTDNSRSVLSVNISGPNMGITA